MNIITTMRLEMERCIYMYTWGNQEVKDGTLKYCQLVAWIYSIRWTRLITILPMCVCLWLCALFFPLHFVLYFSNFASDSKLFYHPKFGRQNARTRTNWWYLIRMITSSMVVLDVCKLEMTGCVLADTLMLKLVRA